VEISSCGFTRTASQNIASADIGAFEFENLTPEEYWHKRRINATVAWGKLYRLILFKSIKYPVGKIHEDTFTTWKLMFQCSEITSTEDRLYCYYINPESITASTWTPHRMAVLDALKEQIDFFDRNGYLKARKPIIEFLFWTSIKQLMLIKGLSPKYDSHIPEIKKWRKYAFTLYSQEFGLIRTVAYLFNIRIIDPAKHILRNESVFSFMKRKIKKKLHIK